MGAFFWCVFRFGVWISLHADFGRGELWARFWFVFLVVSVFGFLYTLTWGGGNYGRIFGVFFDSVFRYVYTLISVYLYTRFLGGGNSGRIFGVFFSRFGVWISLHTDWGGGTMGAFLKFVFDSMFGYLYTLILGGGNYGRVFGVFFDSMFGYLYTLALGGGRELCAYFVSFLYRFGVWISVHTDVGRGEFCVRFWCVFRFGVWISFHSFWEGAIMGAFSQFFSSVFGYLYTLVLGGWNYGHFFGRFFSIRYLDIFTH